MLEGRVVWPFAVLVAGVVWWRGARHGRAPLACSAHALLVAYLGWLVGETFFPLPVTRRALAAGRAAAPGGGLHADLVPFHSIAHLLSLGPSWPAERLLVGNVVVFVPLGLLAPAVWPRLGSWPSALVGGLLVSAGVEVGQLAVSVALGFSYRVTEVDDVLLNVSGVLLGYALWRALVAAQAPTRPRSPLR